MLDQRGDLVEQVGVVVELGLLASRLGEQLALDVGAALGEVRHHLAFGEQRGLVGVGGGDVDLAAAHEAVAAGGTAGVEVQHPARHHLGAVQHHQLVHRAHEGGVAIAPAHHLGNGQRLHRVVHHPREHLGEPGAGHGGGVEQRLGLAVQATFEARDRTGGNALGLHLLQQRRGRLAFGVEGDRDRHQLLGDLLRRGLGRNPGHHDGDAARAGKPAEGAVGGGEAARLEAVGNLGGEGFAQARQRLGRQFLGEQFYEQGFGRHCAASLFCCDSIGKPSASRDSKYACATARDRLRIRPM